jgi:hypothetical protein
MQLGHVVYNDFRHFNDVSYDTNEIGWLRLYSLVPTMFDRNLQEIN